MLLMIYLFKMMKNQPLISGKSMYEDLRGGGIVLVGFLQKSKKCQNWQFGKTLLSNFFVKIFAPVV